jgi:hypothetical protein
MNFGSSETDGNGDNRHNSSTNSTLTDDERTFPLDHALYVDATHEVVVLNGSLVSRLFEELTYQRKTFFQS